MLFVKYNTLCVLNVKTYYFYFEKIYHFKIVFSENVKKLVIEMKYIFHDNIFIQKNKLVLFIGTILITLDLTALKINKYPFRWNDKSSIVAFLAALGMMVSANFIVTVSTIVFCHYVQ